MDYNTSHGVSDTVVDIIDPDQQLEAIKTPVRKLAHLVEYAALGVAIMLLVGEVYRDFKKRCLGFACFYALLVAVVDEHIQSFSDRTSSTADILLDFLGAALGMTAVVAVFFVVRWAKRRIGKGRADKKRQEMSH